MAMLTGKAITVEEIWKYASMDDWWAAMKHSQDSPIVITTVGTPVKADREIIGNHAYAVLLTEEGTGGNNRSMLLRNPWGNQYWHAASDVYANTYYTNHITGFDKLA
jgi:hypothetical protein